MLEFLKIIITNSVSLFVIGLFIFSTTSWFSLGRLVGLGHEAAGYGTLEGLAHGWKEWNFGVWLQGPGIRTAVGFLVNGPCSSHSWLWGLGCLKAHAGLLMGGIGSAMAGCRAMAVLGQVSASWCIPDSGVSQSLWLQQPGGSWVSHLHTGIGVRSWALWWAGLCPVGDSLRSAGGSDLHSFQIIAFSLGPGTCDILCIPFNSTVSISTALWNSWK